MQLTFRASMVLGTATTEEAAVRRRAMEAAKLTMLAVIELLREAVLVSCVVMKVRKEEGMQLWLGTIPFILFTGCTHAQ